MILTWKSDYGLRAIYELALHHGKGPISTKYISEQHGMSEPFIEKILQELRKAELVEAKHGRNGGYVLTHAPDEISVLDVVEALESQLALVTCLISDPQVNCKIEAGCPTSIAWQLIDEKFRDALDSINLNQVVETGQKWPAPVKAEDLKDEMIYA
ncbi:MAG: RrF2 family transcriptional regulator [Candidatus Bipolaricaulia bacterium]